MFAASALLAERATCNAVIPAAANEPRLCASTSPERTSPKRTSPKRRRSRPRGTAAQRRRRTPSPSRRRPPSRRGPPLEALRLNVAEANVASPDASCSLLCTPLRRSSAAAAEVFRQQKEEAEVFRQQKCLGAGALRCPGPWLLANSSQQGYGTFGQAPRTSGKREELGGGGGIVLGDGTGVGQRTSVTWDGRRESQM